LVAASFKMSGRADMLAVSPALSRRRRPPATQVLIAFKTVRVVDINLGGGAAKRSVTRGTHRAAAVLRALGITDLDPPTPPPQDQSVA
jgi:hypothetical protein